MSGEAVISMTGPVAHQKELKPAGPARRGKGKSPLTFIREFGKPGTNNPYALVAWTKRDAIIKDESTGKVIFEQKGVEAPASWTDQAVNVVASKYFYGDLEKEERETSVKQLIDRVADPIVDWAWSDGMFLDAASREAYRHDLKYILVTQMACFNSPVWFNFGLWHKYGVEGTGRSWRWCRKRRKPVREHRAYVYPQGSACFIQRVDDNMGSIMDLATSEAMLFKCGSGTGTDLSTLRSRREKLSGGGKPSGPLSFMRIYDQIAGTIKSGGKTRRAAKMQTLSCVHPDILDFIDAKWKEELKAKALIREGYEANFNGEAYSSVFFQNANLSVRAGDVFMGRAWGGTYDTIAVTTGEKVDRLNVRDVLERIAQRNLDCGDPGMQFSDTINKWHTSPLGMKGEPQPINSSNPCSEYLFIDDSACNLASINLLKFRQARKRFDAAKLRSVTRIMIVAMETIVDHASYPTEAIARNSHNYRTLGLGFANLGACIMMEGQPYDSDPARDLAKCLAATINAEAYRTSAEIARNLGAFPGHARNKEQMAKVMRMHLNDLLDSPAGANGEYHNVHRAAEEAYVQAIELAKTHGYRNAQATVIAPTGTIAFMMDCDTTGIEPAIALIIYKTLAGRGTLKIAIRCVEKALKELGYCGLALEQIMSELTTNSGNVEKANYLKAKDLPVFDCAFPPAGGGKRTISPMGHLKMMAAVQPHVSGAISKTVNCPRGTSVADLVDLYVKAWKLGVKAVAVYVDGSKDSQPLNTTLEGKGEAKPGDDMGKLKMGDWPKYPKEVASPTPKEVPMPDRPIVGKCSTTEDGPAVRWTIGGVQVDPDWSVRMSVLDSAPVGTLRAVVEKAVTGKLDRALVFEPNRPIVKEVSPRVRMTKDRSAITHKFVIAGHEGYITTGHLPDGTLGEVFVTMNKMGSVVRGMLDAFGIALSLCIQHRADLGNLLEKFVYTEFAPLGITDNPEIPFARSVVDYIARYLGIVYVKGFRAKHCKHLEPTAEGPAAVAIKREATEELKKAIREMPPGRVTLGDWHLSAEGKRVDGAPEHLKPAGLVIKQLDAGDRPEPFSPGEVCPNCNSLMRRVGTCQMCQNCLHSTGCG
jgi:ribonucleoside-diphosphate reductase alpha chain